MAPAPTMVRSTSAPPVSTPGRRNLDADRRRPRHRLMGSGLTFLSILSRKCKIERPDPMELLVSRDGAVLTVTFNRPVARNALTWAMYEGLYRACEEADADDGVRVLVVRGA